MSAPNLRLGATSSADLKVADPWRVSPVDAAPDPDDAIAHHGVLNPGTQFIGKPFTAAELTGKVRDVIDAC
jgi:hypothetical protein